MIYFLKALKGIGVIIFAYFPGELLIFSLFLSDYLFTQGKSILLRPINETLHIRLKNNKCIAEVYQIFIFKKSRRKMR